MPNPLVTVISVNYNHAELTKDFLLSFKKINYSPIEIIVVDNGSDNDNINNLVDEFPEVNFIISEENLGFAGGNNLGIAQARGEFILFINNDTEVDVNFLSPLVETLKGNKKIGIVSPKIIYFNTNIIQYSGSTAVNPYTGRSVRKGAKEIDSGQYNELVQTELAHGAAMMIPAKVIKEVGHMPEIFFLYYEEIDWCEAIKRAGYQIWYVPDSKVYHKESMSVGKSSPSKTYYLTRNRLIYLRRNTSGLKKVSWISFFMIFSIPKSTIKYILKRDWQHLTAFWKSIFWNLSHRDVKHMKSIQK